MKYGRTFNFSAGPAMMPESVLEEIASEVMNYRGSGMSVMEMSHRSKVFESIRDQAEADLRTLMGIPDNYKVLFVQGGGTLQFAMVPMNLMKGGTACYVETGSWSKKAINEAKKFGKVEVAASSADRNFCYIPDCSDLSLPEERITSISVKMRLSTAPPGPPCPTPRVTSWPLTSPPCSSPAPAGWRTMA